MLTYKQSGVDVAAGDALVRRIQGFTRGIGGFAGMVPLDDRRMLVACTDGVGTKLALAIALDQLGTIGQDLVAMCVNDLVTCGATPSAFLDYYATGKLDVDRAERVVRGIAEACAVAGCPLLGGETAEMPGFYDDGKFDLAGFAVGTVDRDQVIDGRGIRPGDLLVGLPSSGVHSNGYSLVRRVLEASGTPLSARFGDLPGVGAVRGQAADATLGDVLLEPTRIYVRPILDLLAEHPVKGLVHVTGGGFDNLDRVLPKGLACRVDWGSWPVPPVFGWIREAGEVPEEDLRRTFNLGVGMALVVAPEAVGGVVADLPDAFVFGRIVEEAR